MDPDVDVGRLEQMTELVIGDPLNMKVHAFNTSENVDKSVLNSIVSSGKQLASSVLSAVTGDIVSDEEPQDNDLISEKHQYIFRVHPLSNDQNVHGPLEALLPGACMEKLFHFSRTQQNSMYCKLRRLQNSETSILSSKSNQESTVKKVPTQHSSDHPSAYIRITSLNATSDIKENYYYSDRRCIYLSNNLRSSLNLEIGSRVILSDFKARTLTANFQRIDLLPYFVSIASPIHLLAW